MRPVEILAPGGSVESIYSALRLGADAVYVGTSRFGARAFAKNPSVEELEQALIYAHLRDKKIYLTVNTLLTDSELEEELYELIAPLYEAGLDACIVQDVGVLAFLHRNFPDMELHASTQMTLLSGEEANLYKKFGVTRYVPARELSIEEIKEARSQTDLEIEVFVHGALCFCYSGQCLMSEVIGGRSGNRGMCAQPCRFSYQTEKGREYALNTKDICTLLHIPELVEAGIDSFKIEGRMKRPEYSAYVAHLYRKYVDYYEQNGLEAFERLRADKKSRLWEDYRACQDLYNRGGFSRSYLFEKEKEAIVDRQRTGHYGTLVGEVVERNKTGCHIAVTEPLHAQDVVEIRKNDGTQAYEFTMGKDAFVGEKIYTNVLRGSDICQGQKVFRTKNESLLRRIREQIEQTPDTIGLVGSFKAEIGQPVVFTVKGRGVSVSHEGPEWQEATSKPVSEEAIRQKLDALGNTKYQWNELTISLSKDGFMPISQLKKMRRQAIAKWEQAAVCHRTADKKKLASHRCEKSKTYKVWSFSSLSQLKAALECKKKADIYHLKLVTLPPEQWQEAADLLAGEPCMISFPTILRGDGKKRWDEIWAKYGKAFAGVSYFLINSQQAWLYAGKYFSDAIWLTAENMYEMNSEAAESNGMLGASGHLVKVYGRIEVMKTAGALAADYLKTPKKDEFVVIHHKKYGYHSIYTKQPVRSGSNGQYMELDFTLESEKEVQEVIHKWN